MKLGKTGRTNLAMVIVTAIIITVAGATAMAADVGFNSKGKIVFGSDITFDASDFQRLYERCK